VICAITPFDVHWQDSGPDSALVRPRPPEARSDYTYIVRLGESMLQRYKKIKQNDTLKDDSAKLE